VIHAPPKKESGIVMANLASGECEGPNSRGYPVWHGWSLLTWATPVSPPWTSPKRSGFMSDRAHSKETAHSPAARNTRGPWWCRLVRTGLAHSRAAVRT